MILTDKTIYDEIAARNIVIEPLIEENIGTNSVDLTLSKTLLMYTEHVLDVRQKNPYVEIIIPEDGLNQIFYTLHQLSNIRRHFDTCQLFKANPV
jgi:deoxycytidine triphosphate deaminase